MGHTTSATTALGIDVGTQGVRAVLVGDDGRVVGRSHRPLNTSPDDSVYQEQNPHVWWEAIGGCLAQLAHETNLGRVDAVSIVATSGTLVVCDGALVPLRPALMWNDKRAVEQAALVTRMLASSNIDLGVAFRPTFTLPKALWVRDNEPEIWARTRHVLSAGDWLLAKLSGRDPVTDYTNSLKAGADLEELVWPDELEQVGIDRALLPPIVAPGTVIGTVCDAVAAELGLPRSARVVAGVTDANGAQIASGAVKPGRWVTTIGTGTSLKGVSSDRIRDPRGALYCHRQWDGAWVVSVTSHCGAGSFARQFPGANLEQLTAQRSLRRPSSVLVFPLSTRGEFFPVWAPDATRFVAGVPEDEADLFRGFLEGVAFTERLAVEQLDRLGATVSGPQITMGGGAKSKEWMSIRATVLGREVNRPAETSTAYGAALLALGGPRGEITKTITDAVRYHAPAEPDLALVSAYEERFQAFLSELTTRGYLAGAIEPSTGKA